MDKQMQVFITLAILIGVFGGLSTYEKTRTTELAIQKEYVRLEIITNCNYVKRPTEQCVADMSKSLNAGKN